MRDALDIWPLVTSIVAFKSGQSKEGGDEVQNVPDETEKDSLFGGSKWPLLHCIPKGSGTEDISSRRAKYLGITGKV